MRSPVLFLVVALAIVHAGCVSNPKNHRASSNGGPTVCYRVAGCAVALMGMNSLIEQVHRITGEYPAFTEENLEHNRYTCSSLPYRYALLSREGKMFTVCACDTAHEEFHVVVYGFVYEARKMLLVPPVDYDGFVHELAAGRFAIKKNWNDSLDEVHNGRTLWGHSR